MDKIKYYNDSGELIAKVTLSGGRVITGHPVGPDAWQEYFRVNPPPQEPTKVIVNDAGSEVVLRLDPESPEYVQYQADRSAYNERLNDIAMLHFFQDLDVPDGWDVPAAFQWGGVKRAEEGTPEEKLQYIRFHVLKNATDSALVIAASQGEVTDSEVETARDEFFPGEGPPREAAAADAQPVGD